MKIIAFLFAIICCAVIHGAIPFLSVPTLQQALWTSGFAESYINAGWPAIFATNFGYPLPAAIAFGLSGSFLQSTFIALFNMPPAPAYSLMTLCYLILSLWGALRLAQLLGLSDFLALLAALVWCSSAVIWAHLDYSMLALSVALLPFYLWNVQLVCQMQTNNRWNIIQRAILFSLVCLLAVFMDGYGYMMFIVGGAILIANEAAVVFQWNKDFSSTRAFLIKAGIFILGIGLSYFLYTWFIGFADFDKMSQSFFRGWGADVSFFWIPTQGVYGLWDTLHFGLERSAVHYFGDASVWTASFSAVYILLAITSFCLLRKQKGRLLYAFVIMVLFGFYMSLGPSLKFFSVRPAHDIDAHHFDVLMPAEYAIAPTGSGVLSEHLPGFKVMRASYRWVALGQVGAWGLLVLLLVRLQEKRKKKWAALLALLVIITNLPSSARIAHTFRIPAAWDDIDKHLAAPLNRVIKPGSLVAFMPVGNDFLVNYFASVGNYRAYNIGGDKNLAMAQKQWPQPLQDSYRALLGQNTNRRVCLDIKRLFDETKTEYVIIPYIDLLFGTPPTAESTQVLKNKYQSDVNCLKDMGGFQVTEEQYFAVVVR